MFECLSPLSKEWKWTRSWTGVTGVISHWWAPSLPPLPPSLSLCMLSSRPAGIHSLPPPLQPDSDTTGMSANWHTHTHTHAHSRTRTEAQTRSWVAQLVISFTSLKEKKRKKKKKEESGLRRELFFRSWRDIETWRRIRTRYVRSGEEQSRTQQNRTDQGCVCACGCTVGSDGTGWCERMVHWEKRCWCFLTQPPEQTGFWMSAVIWQREHILYRKCCTAPVAVC